MKNSWGFALLLLVVVVILPNRLPSAARNESPQAEANGAPPPANPLKVALLKWYKANTVFNMFPADGSDPTGIAFDGANIWISNYMGGSVTKLQANDGKFLGKFSVGGGLAGGPFGVTFDGANIWVSNFNGYVTKLRASDGTHLGNFYVPAPGFMTFDGANIWVPSTNGTSP